MRFWTDSPKSNFKPNASNPADAEKAGGSNDICDQKKQGSGAAAAFCKSAANASSNSKFRAGATPNGQIPMGVAPGKGREIQTASAAAGSHELQLLNNTTT